MKKLKVTYSNREWLYAPEAVYYKNEDYELKLQLIIPYQREWKEKLKFPVLLYVPGAAWYRQEMYNDIPKLCRLAEQNIVIAMVQHRASDLAVFPAPIEDMHRAAGYLIKNADKFHIDPGQVYLGGHSAGGHIALMTGLTKANKVYGPETVNVNDYEIRGIIAQASPSDLILCQEEELPPWMKTRPSADFLGVERVEEHIELARQASCNMYIKDEVDLPPIILLHGDNDNIVTVEHSRTLYKDLIDTNKWVEYYELDGVGHSGNAFWSNEVLGIVSDFCHVNKMS